MPLYEFTCNACSAPVSVFVRTVNTPVNGKCERCGGTELTRKISNFAFTVGSGSGGGFNPADMAGMNPNDPRAIAAMMRDMGQRYGTGNVGDEYNEMVNRVEAGELDPSVFTGDSSESPF